jgi:hypothetical protein
MALVAALLGGWMAWAGAAQLHESVASPGGRSMRSLAGVRILAVLEIGLGTALLTTAGLLALFGPDRVAAYVRLRPGWLALGAGAALLRGGMKSFVTQQAAPGGALGGWLNRARGLPALIVGAGLVAGGALDALFPGALQALATRLIGGAP